MSHNITTTGVDNTYLAGGTAGVKKPATLADMGVEAGLSLKGYDRSKIYFESLLQDPLINNKNLIEPIKVDSNKAIYSGDKFIVSAKPGGDVGKAADSVTMEYLQALQEGAITGNGTSYVGNEETKRAKYLTVYANDFARPLSSFGFGIDKLGQDYWKMNDNDRKLLSQWIGETTGMYMRQALCEIYSENLTASPINATQGINPNVTFAEAVNVAANPGTATAVVDGVVTYSATATEFAGGVVAGAGAITPANNHLTVPGLLSIADKASQSMYIKPVAIAGKNLYLLYTSREEVRRLRSANVTNSYAEYYLQGSALARVQDVVPQAEMVIGDIIIAVDDRAPTVDTSAGVSFGYMKQGRVDGRTAAGNETFNVNILLGAAALVKYEREMPNFKTQEDDYGKDLGTLIYACEGFNLTVWDVDTHTDTSASNESSLLILTSKEENI